jgi:hypothetical protein
MADTPTFVSTPRLSSVAISTANTNRDGTGSITELIAGVAAGTKVLEIAAQVAVSGSITAAVVTVFISTDNGATWRLFDEITISSTTSSTSAKATRNTATYANLVLPSTSHKLGVATTIAQSTIVTCMAGDLT